MAVVDKAEDLKQGKRPSGRAATPSEDALLGEASPLPLTRALNYRIPSLPGAHNVLPNGSCGVPQEEEPVDPDNIEAAGDDALVVSQLTQATPGPATIETVALDAFLVSEGGHFPTSSTAKAQEEADLHKWNHRDDTSWTTFRDLQQIQEDAELPLEAIEIVPPPRRFKACGIATIAVLVILAVAMGSSLATMAIMSQGRHRPQTTDSSTAPETLSSSSTTNTTRPPIVLPSDPKEAMAPPTIEEVNEYRAAPSGIQLIRERGYLLCGYSPVPGFIYPDPETGEIAGFEASLCRAIAAALRVEARFVEGDVVTRFVMMAMGRLDVQIRGLTHNLERELWGSPSGAHSAFSVPYFFAGLQLAGDPFYMNHCIIAQGFRHVEECSGLKVCVIGGGSTHEKIMREHLPSRKILAVGTTVAEVHQSFARGDCNVLARERHDLAEGFVREAGYTGEYVVGDQMYSKEPLVLFSRKADTAFADLINAVLQALMVAEGQNITQATAHEFPSTSLVFGQSYEGNQQSFSYHYPNAFRDAIRAAGNYGELYERYLQAYTPRQVLNQVYRKEKDSTGLLFAHPFGEIDQVQDNRPLGLKIGAVLEQGFLRCGVRTDRPGLGLWQEASDSKTSPDGYSGMGIDYCRALSASLFAGDFTSVEFVAIEDFPAGAQLLTQNEVDVVAGAPWSLEMDIQETSSGVGFSLSQPYFYGSSSNGMQTACLMTRSDDYEWSAFVYWVVTATIYAEEKGISTPTSNAMPEVLVLGPKHKRMLRDTVLAVGSYADIYERNMQSHIPRQAPNILNVDPLLGPQHNPIAGLFSLT